MSRLPIGSLAISLVALVAVACAPSAPPSATAVPAPPKPVLSGAEGPAATSVPAKPTDAPAAKPAAKPTDAPAAKPAATAAPKPAAKPAFDEKSVADFYRGKTIRILVGSSAGGGFDFWSRLIARYLPQYVPGNPNVVVENRPPNIVTANAVYKSEAKDGTVIGNFTELQVVFQLLGGPGVEYEAAKFNWLGAVTRGRTACLARTDTGIKSAIDTVGGKELIVGTNAPGSNIHDVPVVMKAALGFNFKIVPGYGGLAPLVLAVQQKEVDAFCASFSVMATRVKEMVEGTNPTARFIVVTRAQTPEHAYLKDVPTAESLAKTDEAKQLLAAVTAPDEMSKPYAAAPEVPRERLEALRQAFARMAADAKLVEEAKKGGEEVEFTSGEDVGRIVQRLLATPPPVVAKLKAILK